MATKPLHRYTVAEAGNLQVYEDYKSEQVTLETAYGTTGDKGESADWTDNPAKEVMLIPYSTNDATDQIKVKLKIKGTYGDEIILLYNDFPLTISNLLIDQVNMKSDEGTDELFTIISFH
jgi:hypothetical protein